MTKDSANDFTELQSRKKLILSGAGDIGQGNSSSEDVHDCVGIDTESVQVEHKCQYRNSHTIQVYPSIL
jgi:hypothetical protein